MRKINNIVIHCTGSSQKATVSGILRYWEEELGWNSPGYHRIIKPSGEIVSLAIFNKVVNGVRGHNSNSIHISYIGGKEGIDDRTEEQKASLLECIYEALRYEGIESPVIKGHRDFIGITKYCPSFNALKEYNWITS